MRLLINLCVCLSWAHTALRAATSPVMAMISAVACSGVIPVYVLLVSLARFAQEPFGVPALALRQAIG